MCFDFGLISGGLLGALGLGAAKGVAATGAAGSAAFLAPAATSTGFLSTTTGLATGVGGVTVGGGLTTAGAGAVAGGGLTSALGIGSTVLNASAPLINYYGQVQAAEQQNAYQAELLRQQAVYRSQVQAQELENFGLQETQLNKRLLQEQDRAGALIQEARVQALESRSRQRVSSAEAGASGLSLGSLLGSIDIDANNRVLGLQRNFEAFADQNRFDLESTRRTAFNRSRSIGTPRTTAVQGPSFIGALAGVGNAAYRGYQTFTGTQGRI